MTREDREQEIADYVRYLDLVHAEVRARVSTRARFYLLGFSQGVATAGRWLDRGASRHDAYCFWAGTLPPELNLEAAHPGLAGRRIALAAGHRDEYLPPDWLATESRRLGAAGGEVRAFPFHGGHRLDRTVLAQVAGFFEAA
jgi:predicted esterase